MKSMLIGILMVGVAGLAFAAETTQAPDREKQPAGSAEAAAAGDKAMTQIDAFIAAARIDKTKADWKTTLPKPEVAAFDPAKKYYIHFETTKGPITIKFLPEVAPMHVTNFIYLAKLGFFDGLSFHRVITGFMAQGGDPLGSGSGGPGYRFAGEYKIEVAKHDKPGILSMANAGPGTDGSQFFITFKETPWLDGKHTVFGEVTEGMETVKKLEAAGSRDGTPRGALKMDKATVSVQ
jgi:peptidyl-prolyl cis-trans isomerase B (cyclophilin B)